jgi:hypothetical protein
MYPLLTLSGTLKTWQIRYCHADYQTCERYKRAQQGLPVAAALMPSGALLRRATASK